MMKRRLQTLVVLVLVASMLTACSKRAFWTTVGIGAAATAVAAGVYYAKGDLESDLDHDVGSIYNASVITVGKRGYTLEDRRRDSDGALVKAKMDVDGKEKTLTIKIKSVDKGGTHISIRVGTMGNEALSREILEDIQKIL